MATYNGEKYIKEQIDSILPQLGEGDELVISDDGSADRTVEIIESYKDPRIRLYHHVKKSSKYLIDYSTHNFENAISHAKGQYIFLSDQDDVWLPEKVDRMIKALEHYEVVVSDCLVVDESLNEIAPSYFSKVHAKNGMIRNIIKSSYIGCCMAFRREILNEAFPFPKSGVGHDLWIALIGSMYYNVFLLPEPLLLYRKHGNNVTPSGMKSNYSLGYRISYRLLIVQAIIKSLFPIFKHK